MSLAHCGNSGDAALSDESLVALANQKRISLPSPPTQSNFRVYAILVVNINGVSHTIEGTNAEQGFIGGAICAERSALVKLRYFENPVIERVVVVTDSKQPISPGLLCREYLMSAAKSNTLVIMGSGDGNVIVKCKLGDLLPFPYIYRLQKRNDIKSFALTFSSSASQVSEVNSAAHRLHQAAMEKVYLDKHTDMHPLQFAAAVQFDNGDIEVAWQLKGLEYGCTLDPVVQLIREMEKRKHLCGNVLPVMLVMTDQFGVCHAPFAQGRALLTEYGYDDVMILVHDESGSCCVTTAASLAPSHSLLSHDDFDSTS